MLSCTVPNFHLVPLSSLVGLRPPSDFFIHSLFTCSVQDTTPCSVLSSCGCSLPLTLATSIGTWHSAGATKGVTRPAAQRGIWHDAGATISWSSLVSWSCSCWISLGIRSNDDSCGWATRIIHCSLLISIQYSVHHSNPPRNHHCCYQEPFISTYNWKQAHIQSHFSCCHSSKVVEFIAIDCVQNPLISEIERPRCST